MSWDVIILNTRGNTPPPIDEFVESDYQPLGSAAEVRRQLTEKLPAIDWTDSTCGSYEGEGFSIQFNVGAEDPINSMSLYVRGTGDAVAAIATFAPEIGWSALDCSTSEFLDFSSPSQAGW